MNQINENTSIPHSEYNAKRNLDSCIRYIDALFKRYSRLLVLRVDFLYRAGCLTTFEEAQVDIEHFLRNRRNNKLFDTLVGYIIKMEWHDHGAPHFHCIFLLDGSKSYRDIFLAQQYGNYWKMITLDRGFSHSCNMEKIYYSDLGVGMIRHDDRQMRSTLINVVAKYVTDAKQVIPVDVKGNARTFFRGAMPTIPTSTAHRPRAMNNDSDNCFDDDEMVLD